MTAIAHWVIDDFVAGKPFKSRIGNGVAHETFGAAAHIIEAYMNRAPRRLPAKVYDSNAAGSGFLLDQPAGAADSILPIGATVRTLEFILRKPAIQISTPINFSDGDGLNICTIQIDDSNNCTVLLGNSSGDTITLSGTAGDFDDGSLYRHVCIVLDFSAVNMSKRVKVYVDGVSEGQDAAIIDLSSWTPTIFDDTMEIMEITSGGVGFCELMVHDVELPVAQIRQRSFYMRAINAQE